MVKVLSGLNKGSKVGLGLLMGVSALVPAMVVSVDTVEAATPNADSDFEFDSSTGEITKYKGSRKDVVIPATIDGKEVKSIKMMAFQKQGIVSVVIPEGVKSIGNSAFGENEITGIVIPESVENIGDSAFYRNRLKDVEIPEGVIKVGQLAFSQNEIESLTISKSVESIGIMAFGHNKIKSVKIPGSLKVIQKGIFQYNEITEVTIAEGVETIGENVFQNNNIRSVIVPKTVTSIGDYAFQMNELKTVKVSGEPTIGKYVFGNQKSKINNQDVHIYGKYGTMTETYANANNHPFNDITDWETGGSGGGSSSEGGGSEGGTTSSSADQNIQLKINAGDLYLDVPEIVDFGEVTLGESAKVIGTKFTDKFKVTDARGTGEGWKLTVKATNFKEVEPSGGFKEGTGGYELPHGSLTITNEVAVAQINGNKGILPSKELSSSVVIDAESPDSVLISQAGKEEGMGTFGYTYGEGALKLVVDPSTAKIDRDNYPEVATPYESTVTWELVSGL